MMKTKLSIFCEKILEAGWLAAVVSVPLFFNIYSARTFEPDKITLLRSIALVMSLAWLVLIAEQGRAHSDNSAATFSERWRSWFKAPLVLPTVLLVLIYIVSTIFSLSPLVSLWGSYQRLQGTYSALSYILIFALLAGNLRTREQADRLVTTIIVTSIPVSLYGIVQRYGLDPLPWAGDVTIRVASTMGNAIFVASYLIMVMPLTMVRLVESMAAIIKEEEASWGYTVLSAVYIFALAVQTLTVIFSQSRGPMLGILGAAFVMGLLLILTLRQRAGDTTRLSLQEVAAGVAFIFPLGILTLIGGGLGYGVGLGLQSLFTALGYQAEIISLLGVILGGVLGFVGAYAYMAATGRGWRWVWVSWLAVSVVGIIFVLALNLRGTGFDPYLDTIRELPYVGRLAQLTQTESGTGRVRVLIWDAALELVQPHGALGIPNDSMVPQDRFNMLRPLVGYGPESMFNAFAYVYPPELAHVENRGSSADRSHNETVDTLVITGLLGFVIFYFLMISVFYYALVWLGWAPNRASKLRLIIILTVFGLLGGIAAYLADLFLDDGGLTFVPLGLPFGLIAGVLFHLIWQAFIPQDEPLKADHWYILLLIGIFGAIIGHFIEVHFVFSIAATYTYFWVYAGLLVALARMKPQEAAETTMETVETDETEADLPVPAPEEEVRRSHKARRRVARRRAAAGPRAAEVSVRLAGGESWETWVGSQGLAMAIIFIILNFNFITPNFEFSLLDQDSMSLLWMFAITWIIGLAITLSDVVIRRDRWGGAFNLVWAALLYGGASLGYFFIFYIAHAIQFGPRIVVEGVADVVRAASVLANGLVVFYVFLGLLLAMLALMLGWSSLRRLPFWRAENWWLYPSLALAIVALIWFKNVNVVRADIYLKEGDRYRSGQQWDYAVALHDLARSLDSDEDFYYLMLALDYQLMAQDGRLEAGLRDQAWRQGENIALEARRINPYNPDNTGNMGRYYFTLGQIFDPQKFQDALDYFERATTLAPSNVIYHNLWAQTYYILQDYEAAIDRLKISVDIDPRYPPTWQLLGDTYAAMGQVDEALEAHTKAMNLVVRGSDGFAVFADQFVDQRLNFYLSAGRLDDIIAAMQQVAAERPDSALVQRAIGHAYSLAGQAEQGIPYLEQAMALGDTSVQTAKELANLYMALEAYDQAAPLYQYVLQNASDIEAHSSLGYIYAQRGNLEEAIRHNQAIIELSPNDYDSLKNLAILHRQTEQYQAALDYARQAQAVAPDGEAGNWDQFISELEDQLAKAG